MFAQTKWHATSCRSDIGRCVVNSSMVFTLIFRWMRSIIFFFFFLDSSLCFFCWHWLFVWQWWVTEMCMEYPISKVFVTIWWEPSCGDFWIRKTESHKIICRRHRAKKSFFFLLKGNYRLISVCNREFRRTQTTIKNSLRFSRCYLPQFNLDFDVMAPHDFIQIHLPCALWNVCKCLGYLFRPKKNQLVIRRKGTNCWIFKRKSTVDTEWIQRLCFLENFTHIHRFKLY